MEDKNYEPEVMPETPFPDELVSPVFSQTQVDGAGNYTPTTTKEKTFPKKKTAVELLSTALNTRSKKILQEFQLQDTGGFKVGDFKEGISGDLRITPNGLTARNISGITTFAIDGDTGEAFFLGTIRAGSIIADALLQGGSIDIGGDDATSFHVDEDGNLWLGNALFASAPFKVSNVGALTAQSVTIKDELATTIIDATGLVSTANFPNGSYSATNLINNTSSTPADISGSDLTFTLARTANVLISLTANADYFPTPGGGGYGGTVYLNVDGSNVRTLQSILFEPSGDSSGWENAQILSFTEIRSLAAGSHTIKLQWATANNGQQFSLRDRSLLYVVLGS